MAAGTSTLYCTISPITFSDFTPSRVTRPSSNPVLQEHSVVDSLCKSRRLRQPSTSSLGAIATLSATPATTPPPKPTRGRYVQVEFVTLLKKKNKKGTLTRKHSNSDPTGGGDRSHALHMRSRIDPSRKAVRVRNLSDAHLSTSLRAATTCRKPRLRLLASSSQPSWPTLTPSRRRYSPPAPPPPTILSRSTPSGLDRVPLHGEAPPSPPLPIAEIDLAHGVRETYHASRYLSSRSVRVRDEETADGGVGDDNVDGGGRGGSSSSSSSSRHFYSGRCLPLQSADSSCDTSASSPPFSPQDSVSDSLVSPLASPLRGERCPPTTTTITVTVTAPSDSHAGHTNNNGTLYYNYISHYHQDRPPSFLDLEPGTIYSLHCADYMGLKAVDEYADRVDESALQLINSRPTDAAVYVTAQRVHVTQRGVPGAGAGSDVLVASFAVRDVLHVSRCSKNRWIIGITTWRFRSTPECRIFKCGDSITATALYEAVQCQVQNLDNVAECEEGAALASQAPLWAQCPSSHSHLLRSKKDPTKDSPLDAVADHPAPTLPLPPPPHPTWQFHKFQATYIGSTVAGKTHSVHELVERVLGEHHPSQARESLLWLGGAQLRLTDLAKDPETAFALHDVVRIRAMGVYSADKRFVGYVIKEEGKPLMGHVLHCCTTGLMLRFLSELRRACEEQFQSRGGSLYEELSIEDCKGAKVPLDIEDEEKSHDLSSHTGLLQRLKTFTLSQRVHHHQHHQHHLHSSTKEVARFYTSPPNSNSSSPEHSTKKREEWVSHTGVGLTEEDYARFTVTYLGSTNMDPPFRQQAVVDAVTLLGTQGVLPSQTTVVSKSTITMQVAALGITLSDQSHHLFVTRNYPRNQIVGYCVHLSKPEYFAFATRRPGFGTLRCHVFRQLEQPCDQILGAMGFWLEMNQTTS